MWRNVSVFKPCSDERQNGFRPLKQSMFTFTTRTFEMFKTVLGQLPQRKISPYPNPNPNSNLNRGAISSVAIVPTPFKTVWKNTFRKNSKAKRGNCFNIRGNCFNIENIVLIFCHWMGCNTLTASKKKKKKKEKEKKKRKAFLDSSFICW